MTFAYPPPKQRGHVASVFGWIFLGMASLGVIAVVLGALLGSGKSWLSVAITCVVGVVVAATGVGLIRLHAWAVVAAAFETSAGAIALFAHTVFLVRSPPGPPGTDGAAYELMASFMWAVVLAVIGVVLIRPSVRRTLRTPGAGWFPDPWKLARLRWWDGAKWCGSVSP